MAKVWQKNTFKKSASVTDMAKIWQKYGKYMAKIWQIYGKYMANIWQIYGKYMANIWQIYILIIIFIYLSVNRTYFNHIVISISIG